MQFILLPDSCLKCEPLGLALSPAPEICLGKGAYWYMTNKSASFCLMATHVWINQRVVSSSHFEDVPRGPLLGSKRRKDDTSRQLLLPQEEKRQEGNTLSESNCSAQWCHTLREPLKAPLHICCMGHPLLSGMFLPLKKVHIFPYDVVYLVHSQLVLATLSSLFSK